MTGAIDRTFVRLGWAILGFLVIAFLVFMVNQTASFVDLVATGFSPDAGRVALWVLVGLYVLLLLSSRRPAAATSQAADSTRHGPGSGVRGIPGGAEAPT